MIGFGAGHHGVFDFAGYGGGSFGEVSRSRGPMIRVGAIVTKQAELAYLLCFNCFDIPLDLILDLSLVTHLNLDCMIV